MAHTIYQPFDYDRFRFQALLSGGSFGNVYLAEDIYNYDMPVAIKVQRKPQLGSRVDSRQEAEAIMHTALSAHPNIISLVGAYSTEGGIYHAMELSDGLDLHDALRRRLLVGRPGLLKRGFGQIIRALQFMHSKQYYHRDLKPENILLSADLRSWRLCDFGLASFEDRTRAKGVGSGCYRSPECLSGDYDNGPADVWSLGVSILYAVTGRKPWGRATPEDPLYSLFLEAGPQFFLAVGDMTAEFFQFIRRLFELDPRKRITLREAARELKALSLDAFRPTKDIDYDSTSAYCIQSECDSPPQAYWLPEHMLLLEGSSFSSESSYPMPQTPETAPCEMPLDAMPGKLLDEMPPHLPNLS